MLELRPTCENCNCALPAYSTGARICSYECTFCATCVDNVLGNVCPNCGGGFVPAADPAEDELEGRQLSRQGPGEHQGQAPAGRFRDACCFIFYNQ